MKMKKYSVPKNFKSSIGHNSLDNYQSLRKNAEQNSNSYWESVAERIDWFDKWTTINNTDYSKAHIEWFSNGKLNASYNCIDRHAEKNPSDIAIIWEGDDPNDTKDGVSTVDVNNVTVSHYRLSLHLSLALLIISILFWIILNTIKPLKKIGKTKKKGTRINFTFLKDF